MPAAASGEGEQQCQSSDRRRQHDRQIDERVQQPDAAPALAGQHQRQG